MHNVDPQGTDQALKRHADILAALDASPYSLKCYLQLSHTYAQLGYPDLACGAAYKALLLADALQDDSDEYHEVATTALESDADDLAAWLRTPSTPPPWPQPPTSHLAAVHIDGVDPGSSQPSNRGVQQATTSTADLDAWLRATLLPIVHHSLARNLLLCNCHRSAFQQCQRGLGHAPQHAPLLALRGEILRGAREYLARAGLTTPADGVEVDLEVWPDSGLVRRECYPWNAVEPDRFSRESLDFLNAEMVKVAPKLRVEAVELPSLAESGGGFGAVSKQLGVFAGEDIAPGELVLEESSLLTANNRLQDAICDACGLEIGSTGKDVPEGITCEECFVPFCSEECLDRANASYHPAVCDKDVDSIARDVPAAQAADSLYLLLLLRTLAMAETQETHPLELKEVKYIWGDYTSATVPIPGSSFLPADSTSVFQADAHARRVRTLPFSLEANVALPFHMLTKMDVDIFASHRRHDVWVFNTLYAKFRGTASARLSGATRGQGQDGAGEASEGGLKLGRGRRRGPEVSAVHPNWCMANHSCDPNVTWDWGGTVRFHARKERVQWRRTEDGEEEDEGGAGYQVRPRLSAGIRKGEEVFSHYCDIDLPVAQRREWAVGALGGNCRCDRCVWEAREGA